MLERIHLNAAGIDVGSASHWVAVPEGRSESSVREFKSFTTSLNELADWLASCVVETVAMESTGVYWIPLFEILEARGFKVILVNARHVKGVPGRKSDVLDCQWLQQLHTFGLLRGSFRPDQSIVALRSLVRHRDQLVEAAVASVQRMQKSMSIMNLQLHTVISDVTGITGLAILRDIVAGVTDPNLLARHRNQRCKATEEEIAASLTGHYRPEQVFVLRQALELYDFCHVQMQHCDHEIESLLGSLEAESGVQAPLGEPPKRERRPRANEPRFDLHSQLYRLCRGVDLSQLPGLGPYGSLKLLAEIGRDMGPWPSEKHFTAWLTLAPRNKITGGKTISSRTMPSANRAAKVLRLAAMSLMRSDHALGAFYRRMAARLGKPKAVTATARKLAILVYHMLRHQTPYRHLTAADYDQTQRSRILRGLRRRAASFGLDLFDPQTGALAT